MSKEETWTDDNRRVECPNCHEMNDFSDDFEVIYTEDGVDMTCRYCDKEFELYGSISWTWTAYEKEATDKQDDTEVRAND